MGSQGAWGRTTRSYSLQACSLFRPFKRPQALPSRDFAALGPGVLFHSLSDLALTHVKGGRFGQERCDFAMTRAGYCCEAPYRTFDRRSP